MICNQWFYLSATRIILMIRQSCDKDTATMPIGESLA